MSAERKRVFSTLDLAGGTAVLLAMMAVQHRERDPQGGRSRPRPDRVDAAVDLTHEMPSLGEPAPDLPW